MVNPVTVPEPLQIVVLIFRPITAPVINQGLFIPGAGFDIPKPFTGWLAHRQQYMGMVIAGVFALTRNRAMDGDIGHHAEIDKLILDKALGEIKALIWRQLVRQRQYDAAGDLGITARFCLLCLVPQR